MSSHFQKILYDNRQGFSLNHTVGNHAGDSTLGYYHCQFSNMLIYFIHGTGSIWIEGRHYDICEGDMILLNPNELYHCKVDSSVYHERIVIRISESFLNNFPAAEKDLFTPFTGREKGIGNRIPARIVAENGLDTLLEELLKLFQFPIPNGKLLSVCKVVQFLIHLGQVTVPRPWEEISNHDNPLIHDILGYINSHYRENISISGIADHFSFHKSYLSHLFTEQVGMPLWNYVILRRISAVHEFVRQGCSLEEACYQAGFQNYSNFFRLYKKHTGMTPMQYKLQRQEK